MGKRLIDYLLTVKDSIINSEIELLNIENLEALRRSGLAGKLAHYLKDKDFYFYIDDFDFSEVLNFSVKEIVLENIGTPLKLIGNVVVKKITSKNNK